MHKYWRCFLDREERISAAESIEAAALEDAIQRALEMLGARSHHRAVEVWEGERRLYASSVSCTGGSLSEGTRENLVSD